LASRRTTKRRGSWLRSWQLVLADAAPLRLGQVEQWQKPLLHTNIGSFYSPSLANRLNSMNAHRHRPRTRKMDMADSDGSLVRTGN
jgi:hypothetical protein